MATLSPKPTETRNDLAVDLALTAQEGEDLRLMLEGDLADLSVEIAHTDSYDFREELKEKRARLREVFCRLSATLSVATGGGRHTEAP
jgi:hypothetical protein